ncbi:MAG: hypothetical protein OXI87_08565 [Albidovulum sp.]|nr:hypothetical protein [Albidovulum sp.]
MATIRTVLGDIAPERVRNAMIHEHVLFDIAVPGHNAGKRAEIDIRDRWQIDYYSNRHAANAHQLNAAAAISEMEAFREDGGDLVVDQSVIGLARDAKGLRRVSESSGVHIVAATGTYTAAYLARDIRSLGESELAGLFTREILLGMHDTDICAGIIGEIGCSWPLEDIERRALAAAARSQLETGAAISVHPGRHPGACSEIIGILEGEGADLSRTVLCHMDRTYPDGDGVLQILERGVNVEWDFFGIEQSYYWMGDVEIPNDLDRLRLIGKFDELGFGSQLLISHDICTKTRMKQWGGHGYGHILRNVTTLMDRLEFDRKLVEKLLRSNPVRLLAFKERS